MVEDYVRSSEIYTSSFVSPHLPKTATFVTQRKMIHSRKFRFGDSCISRVIPVCAWDLRLLGSCSNPDKNYINYGRNRTLTLSVIFNITLTSLSPMVVTFGIT